MITKTVGSSGWEFGEPGSQIIPVSRRGLTGRDRKDFLKRAGVVFEDEVRKLADDLKPGDVPVHTLAIGCFEKWSSNKNGDGFREEACRKWCWTFEKFAKFYRNHRNRDPANSYGYVKRAVLNPEMHRVELLVVLNGDKRAAERNGGFVADLELERLERGEDLPGSMSCRVQYDVCSGCGNKAKTRKDYCGPDTCPYGGLKTAMGRFFEDGHVLHADNPEPVFFDWSHIVSDNQADRTAYGVLADYLEKKGAESVGDGYAPPEVDFLAARGVRSLPGDRTVSRVGLARRLAELEKRADAEAPVFGVRTPPLPIRIADARSGASAARIRALADRDVLLSPRDFVSWASGGKADDVLIEKTAARLRGIYGRMADDGDLFATAVDPAYDPEAVSGAPEEDRRAALLAAEDCALSKSAVWRRAVREAVSGPPVCVGPADPADRDPTVDALARHYALYKLAALDYIFRSRNLDESDREALLAAAEAQNRVGFR